MEAKELRVKEAHACAGHFAYATVQQHGLEIGAAILAANMRAMVLAHAAVAGWPETDKILAEIARVGKPGPKKIKPHLRIVAK